MNASRHPRARRFAYFDVASQRCRAEAGKYGIELARSADDVQARAELVLPRPIALDVKD